MMLLKSQPECAYVSRTRERACRSVFMVLALAALHGHASAQESCVWRGTSFYCNGECEAGESEMTRASSDPEIVLDGSRAKVPFGRTCLFGSKAFCCKTPRSMCRWDGTAMFCDGECSGSEREATPPPGSSSGRPCWTGSKVYCCTSAPVSTIPQHLNSCAADQAVCNEQCCEKNETCCGDACCAAGTHCCGSTCCDTPCCGDACCALLPPVTPPPPPPPASPCLRGVPCGEKCCPSGLQCCGVESDGRPDCRTSCLH
jgi:hypothetical protein